MAERTPGPWKVERRESDRYEWKYGIHISSETRPVANTVALGTSEQNVADAYLIAAAPALVAALDRLLTWHEDIYSGEPGDILDIAAQARAALLLARGEAPNA